MSENVIDDAFAKRRLKVIQNTSPSQVSAFAEICRRYWYFQSVEGLRDDEEDKPAHLKRGSHIDSRVERALGGELVKPETLTVQLERDGRMVDRVEDWTELVKAVLTHLPDPKKHKLTLQHWGRVPTYDGGPICIVKPDVMHCPTPKTLRIDDLKTTSDFKYCKSVAELTANIQLNTYSRYGYEELGAEEVSIGHAYARTKWDYKAKRPAPARAHRSLKPHGQDKGLRGDEACECAECKAWLSNANRGLPLPDGAIKLTRAGVDAFWQTRVVPQVKLMVAAASTVKDAQELPPSTEKCSKIYGQPCPFRARCGFEETTHLGGFPMNAPTNGTQPTLSERLLAAKAQMSGAPKEQVTSPEKQVVVGTQIGAPVEVAPGAMATVHVGGHLAETAGRVCTACGTPMTAANMSCLPNGTVKHIGCVPAIVETGRTSSINAPIANPPRAWDVVGDNGPDGAGMNVLPPETRNQRESTPEQIAQVESQKRGRGRPKKAAAIPAAAAPMKISAECVFCQGLFSVDKIDAHQEMLHPVEMQKRKDEEAAARRAKEDAEEEAARQAKIAEDAAEAARRLLDIPDVTADGGVGEVVEPQAGAPAMSVAEVREHFPTQAKLVDAQVASDRRQTAQAHIDETLAKARTGERRVPPSAPVLYVDCYPRKGEPATLGDVWLAPIAELAALANKDKDGNSAPMEDYRLISYTADGVLAVAIRACLDSCPARLALNSENRTHRVALEVLTPFAREIVGR